MRRANGWFTMGATAAAACVIGSTAPVAQAVTVTSKNTSVTVAENLGNIQHGITSWAVDGVNHNFFTNYYYRAGTDVAKSFSDLTFVAQNVSTPIIVDPPGPVGPIEIGSAVITTLYSGSFGGTGFEIETKYTVSGGAVGSGSSTLDVLITTRLTNGSSALPFSIYEYADMDLTGDVNDNAAAVGPANVVQQSDATTLFTETASSQKRVGAEIVNADPTHFEVDNLGGINVPIDFNGNLGDTQSAGAGDKVFAFQFDFILLPTGPDTEFSTSISKIISQAPPVTTGVPEPATTAMGLMGLSALGLTLGRRRVKA